MTTANGNKPSSLEIRIFEFSERPGKSNNPVVRKVGNR